MVFAGDNSDSYYIRILTITGNSENVINAKNHVEKIIQDDSNLSKSSTELIINSNNNTGFCSDEILVPKRLYSVISGKDNYRLQNWEVRFFF